MGALRARREKRKVEFLMLREKMMEALGRSVGRVPRPIRILTLGVPVVMGVFLYRACLGIWFAASETYQELVLSLRR